MEISDSFKDLLNDAAGIFFCVVALFCYPGLFEVKKTTGVKYCTMGTYGGAHLCSGFGKLVPRNKKSKEGPKLVPSRTD